MFSYGSNECFVRGYVCLVRGTPIRLSTIMADCFMMSYLPVGEPGCQMRTDRFIISKQAVRMDGSVIGRKRLDMP